MSIGFFLDSGLSQPAARLVVAAATDGSGYSDHLRYLGHTTSSREYVAASDPGVDEITVSIDDSAGGTSLLPSAIRLAVVQEDLGTATPGAALDAGTLIPGYDPYPVWIRVDIPETPAAIYDNLSLITNDLISREAT